MISGFSCHRLFMTGTDASSGWFILDFCHMLLTLSLKVKILRLVFLNGKKRNGMTESLHFRYLSEGNWSILICLISLTNITC